MGKGGVNSVSANIEKGVLKVRWNMYFSAFINEGPLAELARFINGANINLKSFDDGIYHYREEGVYLESSKL